MDMETARLLTEIKTFLRATGMKATYFGQQAANNCRLVERLERGRTVTIPTAARVRIYMSNPAEREKAYQAYLERVDKRKQNGKKR